MLLFVIFEYKIFIWWTGYIFCTTFVNDFVLSKIKNEAPASIKQLGKASLCITALSFVYFEYCAHGLASFVSPV